MFRGAAFPRRPSVRLAENRGEVRPVRMNRAELIIAAECIGVRSIISREGIHEPLDIIIIRRRRR